MKQNKPKYVTVGKATYNATLIAGQSFEDFKKESIAQAEAALKVNKDANVHFAGWGDQQEAQLKAVYDAAVAVVKPDPPPPQINNDPLNTEAGDTANPKKIK